MRQFLHVRMQLECSDPSKRSDAAVAQDMRISRQKALLQILREGAHVRSWPIRDQRCHGILQICCEAQCWHNSDANMNVKAFLLDFPA